LHTRQTPHETPLFFSAADRPLYGVFHAPAPGREGAPLVVHCHSVGVEQVTMYRNEVLAARRAAARGFPVFRWHGRGHGDSGGDFADVTLESLVEDALAAADHGMGLARASGVVWLGVRFGALVAAAALARRADSRGLALWEPVHRPADYFRAQLRGMLFSMVAKGERPDATVDQLMDRVRSEGRVDVHGYFLHRALVESVAGVELPALLSTWARPTLLAQIQARPKLSPPNAALAAALRGRGATVTTLEIKHEPGWHFIQNPPWLSDDLARGTAEWLHAMA
jgi:pimeloyl-ACP methyl ester carboxylesterase